MKTVATIILFLSLGLVSSLPYIPINYIPVYYPHVYPTYQQVVRGPPIAPIVIDFVDYFTCNEEGLFPDPRNCTNYIQCRADDESEGGFMVTTNQCPPELAFNSVKGDCDFAYTVNCFIEDETEDTEDTEDNIPQVEPIVIDFVDYFTCNEEGLFPDPKNCTNYIQCRADDDSEGGFMVTTNQCPPELAFNSEKGDCDFAYTVNCIIEDKTEDTEVTEDNKPQVEPVRLEEDDLCQGLSDVAQFVADPTDCTKYYRCANGQAFPIGQCPAGTIFDQAVESGSPCVFGVCDNK